MISRRVPFITFRLLNLRCLVHQTYNQLYANADADLAALTSHKDLLGYHDVRVGNQPDRCLTKFIQEQLPDLVGGAKKAFEKFNPVHVGNGRGLTNYTDWDKLILVHKGIWKREREEVEQEEGGEYPEPPDVS